MTATLDYQQTIDYLYNSAPLFQNLGAGAYKPGLQTTEALDAHFDHPHSRYRTIHIAGTNGKGSCASTIAAVLQTAGYKVGLFTSPHLVDFRERIRVNGVCIPEEYVVKWVVDNHEFFEPLHPSFFELTTSLAFKYFADAEVDVAVIEVGLGGRLDCTNIITPDLCVITNISLDHTDLLGHTLAEIAQEKAGIMKAGIPCIVGEVLPETLPVFQAKAAGFFCPLYLAEEYTPTIEIKQPELTGDCQERNRRTILCALSHLAETYNFTEEHIQQAFSHVTTITGLRGRWEKLNDSPLVICDTGHNSGGWQYLGRQLQERATALSSQGHRLRVVFGVAADKDVSAILALLPRDATFYWTQASVRRAMDSELLAQQALSVKALRGNHYTSVGEAYASALRDASADDMIFVGGSCFVVADLLTYINTHK